MLQNAPGHWSESIALYALVVGLDRFEVSIPEIAKQTQFCESKLREIVDSARQAELAPIVARQHLVSDKLLLQWGDKSHRVSHYDVLDGRLNPGSGPVWTKDVAYVENYISVDSRKTENLWGKTETNVYAARKAIKTQTLLKNQIHVKTIRDFVALHYARSHEALRESDKIYMSTMKMMRKQFMDLLALDSAFPTLSERRLAVNDRINPVRQLHKKGMLFRFRIVDLFGGAKQAVADAGIRLLRPERGSEFLIGDAPVIISAVPGQRSGMSLGTPIGNAAEAYLPLGPKLAVVINMRNTQHRCVEITSEEVERYNRWEVEAAVHDVIMRPGSELEQFPPMVRPARTEHP